MSDSVKDEEFYGSVKRKSDRRRRRRYCPFCGNEMRAKVQDGYVFCDVCHRRMPWTVTKTDDKPIKPL